MSDETTAPANPTPRVKWEGGPLTCKLEVTTSPGVGDLLFDLSDGKKGSATRRLELALNGPSQDWKKIKKGIETDLVIEQDMHTLQGLINLRPKATPEELAKFNRWPVAKVEELLARIAFRATGD